MAQQPLINGTRHSWGSVKTNILGRTVSGIDKVSYSEKQAKTNRYGAGNMPVARGRGKYEADASVTLHAYEADAILRAAQIKGYDRLVDIPPFDIVVQFMPEGDDGIVTHVLRNCEFTSNKRDLSSGDDGFSADMPLIISHVDWS